MRHHLAALAVTVPLLAGCGAAAGTPASDSAPDAPAAVQAVAREADGDALVAKLRTALEQLTTTRFEVRLTGRLEATATGAADLTTTPPTVQLTPDTALMGLDELRLVDGVGYARIHGDWVEADLRTLLAMAPVDLAGLDLDALADALASGVSGVEVSGDTGEEVWRATIDPARIARRLGVPRLGAHVTGGDSQVDLTATFTGDQLDAVVVDAGVVGGVEVTLSDQGEPVDVSAPRGAVDFTDFGWFATTPGG